MKVLRIDADFILPDDFNGSFSDALLELAKYHNSKEAGGQRVLNEQSERFRELDEIKEKYLSLRWREFIRSIDSGRKVYCDYSCGQYDGVKWTDYPL